MIDLWRRALESASAAAPTCMVAVVAHSGSVPGKTGAKLVVSGAGLAGTIGGGIAEKELIDRARGFRGPTCLVPFQHAEPATDSYCSGEQVFALVALTPADCTVLEEIVSTLEAGRHGALSLGTGGLSFAPGATAPTGLERHDDGWTFRETIGILDTLYLIGGGHVALALSRVMASLPFAIVVLDDREDLPTMNANRWATETRLVDYDHIAEHIPDGEHSWVAIMTHGHRADQSVLAQLAGRSLRYLGMMGSTSKVSRIFANLQGQGVAPSALANVHAPIGLAIPSHSPEEIAISIAAEIIQVRNER